MDTNALASGKLKDVIEELESNCIVDTKEGLETLAIYIHNIISNPHDARFRKIRVNNINYQERLGHLKGGQNLLKAIGFQEEKQYLVLPEEMFRDELGDIQAFANVVDKKREEVVNQFETVDRTPTDHQWKSVCHVAAAEKIGQRPTMEDDHIALDSFAGVKSMGYFAVYDGHGGRESVDFVIRSLHRNVVHYMSEHPNDTMEATLSNCFEISDGQIRRMDIIQSGTTAVTCIVTHESDERILYCANCGDSRAVLCRDGTAARLSRDHKPQDPEESRRIVEAGGFIGRCNRVNGILAVSRALGDHVLKPPVTPEPSISRTVLSATDYFCIMACDGLWDVCSDQEAVDFVTKRLDELLPVANSDDKSNSANGTTPTPTEDGLSQDTLRWSREHVRTHLETVTEGLIQLALDRLTLDNVTAMIVVL
eukprot:229440_1